MSRGGVMKRKELRLLRKAKKGETKRKENGILVKKAKKHAKHNCSSFHHQDQVSFLQKPLFS